MTSINEFFVDDDGYTQLELEPSFSATAEPQTMIHNVE